MDNVEDMDSFKIDTGKYIYIYIYVHFVCCIDQLFIIRSILTSHFILNGIVKIASVCPLPMEEDPSTVVLDDDE